MVDVVPLPAESSGPIMPWVLAGGAAVGVGTAIAFGLSSRAAAADLEGSVHTNAVADALTDRHHGHGLAANVLFIGSAALAASAVVWLIAE